MPDNNKKQLNKAQQEAVKHSNGPALIVAGAGTGKTTVLIERLMFLIGSGKAGLDEILLLTFTEKGAGEMEDRALKALPMGCFDTWISTFHSFCERILRQHALDIGLSPDFKLLTQTEQWILIKKNLDKFNLDYYRPLGNPNKFIMELISHFSRLKDENVGSLEYLEYVEELEADMGNKLSGNKNYELRIKNEKDLKLNNSKLNRNWKLEIGNSENFDEISRLKELANAYHAYNHLLVQEGKMDFGDLINNAIRLFRERPNILDFYRRKFKYVMVDEFQDTNWAQYELVKLLAQSPSRPASAKTKISEPKKAREDVNLMVVGDDDQCLPGSAKILTPQGEKKISALKAGDLVVSGVGRGYYSHSKINFVNKTKKQCRILTIKTKNCVLKATDNHKMFCLVAEEASGFYYVYLMYKKEIGWRIGITNNLLKRLRLEVSSDYILAIKALATEAEARYYEVFYSLKYSIPTVCFMEREGIMTKHQWSKRLYRDIDVEKGVSALARDLGIDIKAYQICLNGVDRGSKTRVKINFELCQRNYRSRYDKAGYLKSPAVLHLLSVETSNAQIIKKLEKNNFRLTQAKKGARLRISSTDIAGLKKQAERLSAISGGIVEQNFRAGMYGKKTKKSRIIPASNILPGMYVPVLGKNGIIYDKVLSVKEEQKKAVVYDLEIDKTHNFVADGVLVHNSIYKFRGASLSNILQFKDDYPGAKEVVLTENYRSGQEILDLAYRFIRHNDPNRLEEKLKINKQLSSQAKTSGEICARCFAEAPAEAAFVAGEIARLKSENQEAQYSDFAVLIRSNSLADSYINELKARNIPNTFVSLKGLYFKPLILDVLAYLKLLDNYHESSALFRVLSMPQFNVSYPDIVAINRMAARRNWSLFEALGNIRAISDVSAEAAANVEKLLVFVRRHSDWAKELSSSALFVKIINDIGLHADWDHHRDKEKFSLLNQFYRKIRKFEEAEPSARLKDFMAYLDMERDAGETGSLKLDFDDSDTVKIMTVHASKGLEFKYVFLVDLADKKFPTINRGEKIPVPDALVKEKVAGGKEFHLEEERRLFYVALTRAKEKLFLLFARDYGGAQDKKPSIFLKEAGLSVDQASDQAGEKELWKELSRLSGEGSASRGEPDASLGVRMFDLPKRFSFSQIEAYNNCPLQYKFNFLLKIPVPQKAQLVFGRVMHNTLKDFLSFLENGLGGQLDMFAPASAVPRPEFSALEAAFKKYWQDEGYENKQERDNYKKLGRQMLKNFYQDLEENGWPKIMSLEKAFQLKIGGFGFKGAIDRIDQLPDNSLEVIDYKTGDAPSQFYYKQKRQLLLYKIALEEILGTPVSRLTFYYLKDGVKKSFSATDKDLDKVKAEIVETINKILDQKFPPQPGMLCKYCDFNNICEFRAT